MRTNAQACTSPLMTSSLAIDYDNVSTQAQVVETNLVQEPEIKRLEPGLLAIYLEIIEDKDQNSCEVFIKIVKRSNNALFRKRISRIEHTFSSQTNLTLLGSYIYF